MFSLSTIITGALNIVSAIAKTLSPVLNELVGPLLTKLANAFAAFFRELGLITPDEETAELGDKALQAEMDAENPIKPENFDLYSEYVEAVKKYKLDPDLSSRLSPEEMERKGMELEAGLAVEKYGESMLNLLLFVSQHPERFADGKWLIALGRLLKEDESLLEPLEKYINHKDQGLDEDDRAFSAMERIEMEISPDASKSEIWESIKQRANDL